MITQDLQSKILDQMEALSAALNEQHRAAREHAEADHAYRQAKAKVYTEVVTDGEKRTVDHIKAIVDMRCNKEMFRVRLAEAERESSMELVRSLRTNVSALQTVLNATKAEADAVRYSQTVGA